MGDNKTNILFLVPYPLGRAPSQRFRVELFLPVLDQAGIKYQVQSFLDDRSWESFYSSGGIRQKILGVIQGFARRLWIVLGGVRSFEFVFVHREASPLGPPWVEWILAKLWRKKIIYDFDDAIWIPSTSSANRWLSWAKATWKIKWICRWAYKVVGGNQYLCEFAQQYARSVVYIPTVVDTDNGHQQVKIHCSGTPVVGWTGSHSTLTYLDALVPTIQKLQEEMDFTFLVIADKDPELPLRNYRFVRWCAESENQDLLQMDIGVMPLRSDPWSEGKCGFKLIQYFAAGLPALASPVGVNKILVEEGYNGFLCATVEQWEIGLRRLLLDVDLRVEFGFSGRQKIEHTYCLTAQGSIFLDLFN